MVINQDWCSLCTSYLYHAEDKEPLVYRQKLLVDINMNKEIKKSVMNFAFNSTKYNFGVICNIFQRTKMFLEIEGNNRVVINQDWCSLFTSYLVMQKIKNPWSIDRSYWWT